MIKLNCDTGSEYFVISVAREYDVCTGMDKSKTAKNKNKLASVKNKERRNLLRANKQPTISILPEFVF